VLKWIVNHTVVRQFLMCCSYVRQFAGPWCMVDARIFSKVQDLAFSDRKLTGVPDYRTSM